MTNVDAAQAEPSSEGRDKFLLRDERAGALHLRGGAVAGGERGVELRLRRRVAAHELALALEAEFGVAKRRLVGLEVRLLDAVVDLDQRRALLHVLAGLEIDRDDDAADLRRDVDALRGAERADGGRARQPFLLARFRHRDARHGLRGGGDEAADHLGLVDEVEPSQPAGEPGERDEDQHQNKYAFHSMHQRSRINDPIPERLS